METNPAIIRPGSEPAGETVEARSAGGRRFATIRTEATAETGKRVLERRARRFAESPDVMGVDHAATQIITEPAGEITKARFAPGAPVRCPGSRTNPQQRVWTPSHWMDRHRTRFGLAASASPVYVVVSIDRASTREAIVCAMRAALA